MAVTTGPMVERQIFHFGQWEPRLTRLIRQIPKTDATFLDLGANIGYFSLLAAAHFKNVIAIEASPSTFKRLTQNVGLNGFQNVTCHNVEIGEKTGTAPFYRDSTQSGASSMIPGPGKVLEAEVPVKPLFAIIDPEAVARIGFIKVDVEGFEHIVMRQILDHIDNLPADVQIMVEYGPERAGDLKDVLDQFRKAGFQVHLLQGPYLVDEYLTEQAVELPVLYDYPDMFCDLLLARPQGQVV